MNLMRGQALPLEEDIMQAWRELFYNGNVSEESVAQGESLLESLRPESPLRQRLGSELNDLRLIHQNAYQKPSARKPAPRPARQPAANGPSQARPATVSPPQPKSTSIMKKEEILAKVAAGEISVDDATKLLAEADKKKGGLYCRVSQKGAISVYGLQRMPVTLYVEQWDRLLNFADDIREFAKENDADLKRKETAQQAT